METARAGSSRAYDIFLSHRGPDWKDFCAFLKEAFDRAGVHAFVDELDLKPGDPAWPTILTALKEARYVLPVFSEGYANSRWCLDELLLMMRTPDKVMPIFFDIDPGLDALVERLPR